MYTQLKPFSLMGMSNSEMLLSDDSHLEFNFLVRPALEFEADHEDEHCEIAPSEDSSDGTDDPKEEQEQEQEQEQERQELQKKQKEGDKCKLMVTCLKVKVPSLKEFKILDHVEEDGLKTPTSLEKRIPLVLTCPPAPRKPKTMPCNKRKLMGGKRRVLLDLSNEIESLFPPSILASKIKKVRPQN